MEKAAILIAKHRKTEQSVPQAQTMLMLLLMHAS